MKPINKRKYELMSQCLKSFKQLPSNLQHYSRNSSETLLQNIIRCSNKFFELSIESKDYVQNEIPLYHRFFSRIRDLIYSYLTYYLHMAQLIFIRQLLMQINKVLLQYRPGSGYHSVLIDIGQVIKNNVINIAISRGFNQKQVENITSQFNIEQYKINEPQISRTKFKKAVSVQMDPSDQKSKSKTLTQSNISKTCCLDAIFDIDEGYLEKLSKSTASEQLYSQCLNRNRPISNLIRNYEQKHKIYENKPANKKNKQSLQYRPTSYSKMSFPEKKQKKRCTSTSQGKKHGHEIMNLMENLSFFQQSGFALGCHGMTADLKLKQEIINNIYAFRQKCCLRKVVIGLQQIQTPEIKRRQRIQKQKIKQKWRQGQGERSKDQIVVNTNDRIKTYSQRFKVLKNSRCYISGVTSVAYGKNDF